MWLYAYTRYLVECSTHTYSGSPQNNFFREVNDNKVSSVSHPLDHGVACYTSSDFFFKEYIRIFLLYKLEAHFRLKRAETSLNTTVQ